MKTFYSFSEIADMLSISKDVLKKWSKNGKLVPQKYTSENKPLYSKEQLKNFPELSFLFKPRINLKETPLKDYKCIELFAGAGGLALGLERSGLKCVLLNDNDKAACETLKLNRPDWNVIHDDVTNIDFTSYHEKVDVLTGGFPCQAFSYAGKKLGFEDIRGTLFYQYARAVNEVRPAICIGENVRGLLNHDKGRTLETMKNVLSDIGYTVLEPQVLKAIFYRVPQKRERLIIVAIRNDIYDRINFTFPQVHQKIYPLREALKKGELYDCDVPKSPGQKYPQRKAEILSMVPQGGYWRDLPIEIQKEYMLKSFYLGGGKTGMARRMSWDEPCLTLTCAPAQKQTERCHPDENRPFTVREYARIQTFPDEWQFAGTMTQQYKQIGNAVPVNLGYEIGISIINALNQLQQNIHRDIKAA